MKTINQVVEEDIEEVRKNKPRYYDFLANQEIKYWIMQINDLISVGMTADNPRIQKLALDYGSVRSSLKEKDLWDTRYNEQYELALRGELNKDKLNEILVK